MGSKKELQERLQKMLQKSEEDLILIKLEIKKEKNKRLKAELHLKSIEDRANSIKRSFNKLIGVDIDKIENNLIKSASQIINS